MFVRNIPAFAHGRVVVTGAGCWEWQGALSQGYGVVRINWVLYRTHRLAYEELVGPIPEGLTLDHLCRNRACCNPEHLEPVTRGENVKRGERRLAHVETCRNGHARTPENTTTQITKSGTARLCRECARTRTREWARKNRREKLGQA